VNSLEITSMILKEEKIFYKMLLHFVFRFSQYCQKSLES